MTEAGVWSIRVEDLLAAGFTPDRYEAPRGRGPRLELTGARETG